MFSPFERLVAFRYLRSRKAEGFVSVIATFSFLGILLGVATLIIVMSVMNGFRSELITRMLGLNGHLSVYVAGAPLVGYQAMADDVVRIPGVTSVAPLIEGQALLTVQGNAGGVMVRGYTQADFARKPILSSSITSGAIESFREDGVAIGAKMAERLRLQVGDTITLIAPKGRASPFGTIPRSQAFPVALIFDVGMFEYNNNFVFMPLEAARLFFQLPENGVNMLEVMTDNPDQLQNQREAIATVTGGMAGTYDWKESNRTFFNALKVERNVMFLILTLIILVAAFNIISSMIMLVKDKARDIAIMRTFGATRASMLRIFLLTGSSIGFVGTGFGAALGISFAMNIEHIRRFLEGLTGTNLFADEVYFLSQLPAKIDWVEVVSVVVMALVLSLLATLYPAWRAAKLDPVEAIRYE